MLFWPSFWALATDSGVLYLGAMEDITVRKKTIAHTMQLMRHGRFELRIPDEARHLAELLAYDFPDPSRTQPGLTELFVNGVEHGNLNLCYEQGRSLALAKAISFDKLDFRGCGHQVGVLVSLKRIDAESWPEEKRKVA